jgi:hypothetical protein
MAFPSPISINTPPIQDNIDDPPFVVEGIRRRHFHEPIDEELKFHGNVPYAVDLRAAPAKSRPKESCFCQKVPLIRHPWFRVKGEDVVFQIPIHRALFLRDQSFVMARDEHV